MSLFPCKDCLKYAICISKGKIKCNDLVKWLLCGDTGDTGNRIAEFENKYWNKDVAVFSLSESTIGFKKQRDGHQCLIVK